VEAQRSPVRLALYISLFPQLIAGPIVRYLDVARHSPRAGRRSRSSPRASAVSRSGIGKKMLIANVLAEPADRVFALGAGDLTAPLAWLGVLCYTAQIYFDFSGYSDMAIGLGRMFGFRFLENFDHPYIARSITEFWHRWHIPSRPGSATTSTCRWAATARGRCAPTEPAARLPAVRPVARGQLELPPPGASSTAGC
jgi:alginate O-acetyltransferase complex protein AlgI